MQTKNDKITKITGGVTAPQGFQAAGVACGLKKHGRDLAMIVSELPATCAGTFTTNVVKAAPVLWTQQVIAQGRAQAIVANSGNANACNGVQGAIDTERMAQLAGQACGLPTTQVVVASTGVIGQPLDMDKVASGIFGAVAQLNKHGGVQAAQAIMTTDTQAKEYAVSLRLSGGDVRIGGMAKGSGMIHPNMATMLCFLTTDADIESSLLQQLMQQAVECSFNMVTVDGDTSTNDMAIILANGAAQVSVVSDRDIATFAAGLQIVCQELAKMVAGDGEGATKLIEVAVVGASTTKQARVIARAIAGSNLVKTAIYGEDANWGRIFCAAGYSGEMFDPTLVDIYLGELQVAAQGSGLAFDEEAARVILQKPDISIKVNLNAGSAMAIAWTCDLTYDYIKINASYRS